MSQAGDCTIEQSKSRSFRERYRSARNPQLGRSRHLSVTRPPYDTPARPDSLGGARLGWLLPLPNFHPGADSVGSMTCHSGVGQAIGPGLKVTGSGLPPSGSPGAGRRAVAVQDFGAAGVPGGGGPAGIQDQGPAPPVDHNLMVKPAKQNTISNAGMTAVSLVPDVVDLARRRGLMTALGPPAPLIPQDHRVADPGRDRAGVPDVERQARPGQQGAQLPGPQERREAARTDSRSAALPMIACRIASRDIPDSTASPDGGAPEPAGPGLLAGQGTPTGAGLPAGPGLLTGADWPAGSPSGWG